MNAACGPYIMSCGTSESTIASNTSAGALVSSNAKYSEAEDPREGRAEHVHSLAAEAVGEMAEQRDRERTSDRGGEHRRDQEVARHAAAPRAVGEHERGEHIERRLLRHAAQRGQDDLARLAAEHFEHRRTLDPALRDQPAEHRRFQNPQPNVQADRRPARCSGGTGSRQPHVEERGRPDSALNARTARFARNRPAGTPNCGQRSDEAAVLVRLRPLHREQHRAAPFAADADALDEAQHRQDDRAPDADRCIAGDEARPGTSRCPSAAASRSAPPCGRGGRRNGRRSPRRSAARRNRRRKPRTPRACRPTDRARGSRVSRTPGP